ncbi:class I SAM-dependent methyltransferase [Peristeroidobacter soli]|jgi:ubiquinone/menaquinone biosynthesis C-methylase UbiE|uniref:class I SAM-dependent methyltransferase n=1 Tax=Peristeroidobacter soli TaxID=2497877 RepID=UPI00101C54A4|nr:methyltransferase domain-containing protein [Peristeroidobacter soli]
MSKHRNPQAEQMADESMVRNLRAQAEAIWPQEHSLLARYGRPTHIADIGCGSGEITSRLAALYPQAQIVGVDILESSAAHARRVHAALAPRVRFEQGDAFELRFDSAQFDLVVCRHMTQAVPEPEKVIAELTRICKPGGWVHVLSEDYGMLHMPAGTVDPDRLWHEGVIEFTRRTHTDARIGRRTWAIMNDLGLRDLHVDYVVVDTLRVPRETFATIIQAWRDGYTDVLAENSKLSIDEIRALFDQGIDSILDPRQYVVWHIPVISGHKPD